MSTAAVIYEGVRRHFDIGRLRQVLADADDFYLHRSNNPTYPLFDASLGEEELLLLQSIDGLRTVADLRAMELLSPLDTDRLIYAMKCAGLIELKGASPAEAPHSSAAPRAPATTAQESGPAERAPEEPPDASGDAELIAEAPDPAAELQGRVGEIGLAEAKFQLGEELLREQQYEAAHQMFLEAVKIYDQAAQFHAYLGWSRFQMQPDDPASAEAALEAIRKAISLNPTVDKSYLFSGYIYKALGRMGEAETHFEKAVQCNPDCSEALRELKTLSQGSG
jgi:tetratricopeptide (TPR) repeat protein